MMPMAPTKQPMTGALFLKNLLICIIWRFPEVILPKILIGQNMQEQSFQAMILSQFPEQPHQIR